MEKLQYSTRYLTVLELARCPRDVVEQLRTDVPATRITSHHRVILCCFVLVLSASYDLCVQLPPNL
jgi:hypothetical protein